MNKNLVGWLLLIFAIAFGAAIVRPKIADVRAITLEKDAKLQLLDNKKQRVQDLTTLSNIFAVNQSRVDALISALPQDPQLPELLVSIEAMANQSGVTIQSIVPQVNQKDQQVSLTLVGQADLGGVESFTQTIADNNRPMSIDSLAMTKNSNAGKSLTFNLVIQVPYIAKPAKGQGS